MDWSFGDHPFRNSPTAITQLLLTIQKLWDQVVSLRYEIYDEYENPTGLGYPISNYIAAETAVLQMQIRCSTQPSTPATNTIQSEFTLQLPKISITKFDGNYLKWQQFYDIFTKMIHDTNIQSIQKIWYLKMNLTGEAERRIRHL